MAKYGVLIAALVLLAVVGFRKYFLLSKKSINPEAGGTAEFVEERLDFAPYGQVLSLSRPGTTTRPSRLNAVFEKLGQYGDGTMPFVGIVVNSGGSDYRFSSADLGGVAAATAAWVRGWVAPCAIVITGEAARHLQRMLDITTLGRIEQLRIVDSVGRRSSSCHVPFGATRRSLTAPRSRRRGRPSCSPRARPRALTVDRRRPRPASVDPAAHLGFAREP
jgi:hypothetical protein